MTKWNRLRAALIVSVPFAEVAVNVFAVKALGPALTYSLFAIPTLASLAFHWRIWQQHIKPIYAEIIAIGFGNKHLMEDEAYRQNFQLLALFQTSLFLVLIPGFITDIAAFLLMIQYFPGNHFKQHPNLKHADATTQSTTHSNTKSGSKIRWKRVLCAGAWLSIPFIEFGIILLLVELCGAATTIIIYFVPTMIGLIVLWPRRRLVNLPRAPSEIFSDANPGVELSPEKKVELNYTPEYIEARYKFFCYLITIYLLFFPGFLTTLVAFAVLLPPGQSLMRSYWQRALLKSKPKIE